VSAVLTAGGKPAGAAALPGAAQHESTRGDGGDAEFAANRSWELDRALMLERSERRAWWVAIAGMLLGLIGIAAVFVQGPLRRVVEIPIVVDRVTGEATIQQRLSVETIPPMEALDKHNLATFVRAREGYSWMFLQRDFDQVARMAVPAVFGDYNRQFEGDAALQKKLGASEDC
jgi:type IV secretion system protein VirB8